MPETKLITYPHQILKKTTKEVAEINDAIKKIIETMKKMMKQHKGVGLAANQIGENLSIFIAIDEQKGKIETFINPKIIKYIGKEELKEEGCLSVPNVWGYVKRYPQVIIEYTNLWNKKRKIRAKGLLAHIIQHEIDHLQGILFIDKAQEVFTLKE
ncbi:MAG: peptide deformylase [Candidatus Parcubacteria bacterium]|nr:MAG: peptide deformylase [Candidatus Parcubacteria bacterium]